MIKTAIVSSLGFNITSRWHGDGVLRARNDLRRLRSEVDRNNVRIAAQAHSFNSLTTAAIALTPALAPISTVLAGVAGGLTAMGAAAGSAGAVYGFAMKSAIQNTLELEKAHKKLTPAQSGFVQELNRTKGALAQVRTDTMSMQLNTATIALQGATAAVRQFTPVIKAVDPVARSVAVAFRDWASGEGMARFVKVISGPGVTALRNLVDAGRNVLAVLGTGFRAFVPLGVRISEVLKSASESMRSWAEGGGFTRFLAKVQANGPAVADFFRALGAATANLGRVMGTLGPLSLRLATALLSIVAAMPPPVINAMAIAFVGLRVAMLGLMIVNVVRQGFLMLRLAWILLNIAFAASPIGLVIAGLALLGTAIYLLATKTRFFQTVWRAVWGAVRAFGLAVWNGLRVAGSAIWGAMQRAWGAVTNGIKRAWFSAGAALHRGWNATWSAMSGFAKSVWNGMSRAASTFWTFMKRGFSSAVSGIRTAWNRLKAAVAGPVRFFVNTVYGGLRKAWNSTAGKIPGVPDLPAARVGFASGGHVRGPGGPRQDKIPAMLSSGEYVINAAAVRRIGVNNLDRINGGSGGPKMDNQGKMGFMLGGLLPDPGELLKKAAGAAGGMFGELFKMAKGVPGLGKMLDQMLKWGGSLTKDILRKAMDLLFKPFNSMLKGITGRFGKSGMVGTFAKNMGLNAFKKMASFVVGKGQDDFNPGDFGGSFGGGGAQRWMPQVLMALKMAGEPLMYASMVIKAIAKESGGNPRAINLWDSNAKAGIPSMGLLQTIGPTFNAYAGSLRGLGPYNPLANIYAAIRYARARYGAGWAFRMSAPGGYASGGLVANSFDSGGYLPKGLSLAYNGTGRPEPVGHGLGGVTVEFTNCTFSGGQGDFEDMVVHAVSNAKRKRRL